VPSSDGGTNVEVEDFSFVGFDHLQSELEAALSQLGIREGQPRVTIVDNAMFVPAEKLGPAYFEGALLSSDGQEIPEATQQRRDARAGDIVLGRLSRPAPPRPATVVDDEVVYLGWYFEHFGHFLLESTARLWALAELDPSVKVLFHVRREFQPSGVFLEMLEVFGIGPDRILVPTVPTRFRRVIVPEPLYEMSHAAHVQMPGPHQIVAERMLKECDPFDQPVYLSRRLLPPHRRPTVGEHALEEILRENGFQVVHPETMTFSDQVRLANRYHTLFAEAGSALYLSLFALSSPRLHVLSSDIPFLDYFLVPKVVGAETSYCNCLTGGHRANTSYLPLRLQLDKVTNYLRSLGLLYRTARTALAPSAQDLQAEYDELRVYALVGHVERDRSLLAEVESEALELARMSWPVSWALARYYAVRGDEQADPMVRQFAMLAANETNHDRLAYFYQNIRRVPGQITQLCTAETLAELRKVLAARFAIDVDSLLAAKRTDQSAAVQ
jgi:capsular polysaccharide biosynthesis protein